MNANVRNISNYRLALFALASSAMLLSVSTATAQNVNFYCGNVEFQLDTARSTMTNRFLSNEPVQWEYDGEWVRWTVRRSNEAFGVNVVNGYFISGGQSADSGCRVENPATLASLPLSEGAALRRIFISLQPDVRRSIQDHLRFKGLYNSTSDGLWGRGTQAALIAYASQFPSAFFREGDIRTVSGASIVFDQINMAIMQGEVCSDCESFQPLAVDTASSSQEENPKAVTERDLDRALAAFNSGDHETALQIWRLAADQGVPRGMHNIGYMHESGIALQSDQQQAFEWYLRAANLGYAASQMDVARMYRSGRGVQQNYAETLSWYLRVANANDSKFVSAAYFEIGGLYANGLGMAVNTDEATRWYEKAAQLGYAEAQRALDELRAKVGVKQAERVQTPDTQSATVDQVNCAETIVVRGLCWEQPRVQMLEHLKSRGFNCAQNQFGYDVCAGGNNASVVLMFDETAGYDVYFSCENFGACQISTRDLGQQLVRSNLVSLMEYRSFSGGEGYCGSGSAGDQVCVAGSLPVLGSYWRSRSSNIVVLQRGAYTSGGINFD